MKIKMRTNNIFGVPFPMVIADRFFQVYKQNLAVMLDIFWWDESDQRAIYEIRENTPVFDNMPKHPTAAGHFSQPSTGSFVYKFRLGPGAAEEFEKIPADKEIQVLLENNRIVASFDGEEICTFEPNRVFNIPIGVQIGMDGNILFRVSKLPKGLMLVP